MVKNIFLKEICDEVLCEAAESFEDESYGNCVNLYVLLFQHVLVACKIYIIKQTRSVSCVLQCDKTLGTFENTREM